jgi:hypothetical protein
MGLMPTTLLPDVAQEALERVATEARREPILPLELRELFFLCGVAADVLERSWQDVRTSLQGGAEARGLAQVCERTIEVAGFGLDVFARVGDLAHRQVSEEDGDFPELGEAARRVTRIREQFASLAAWLTSARPEVNATLIRSAGESPEDYENLDAIIDRLQGRRVVTGGRPCATHSRSTERGCWLTFGISKDFPVR